MTNQGPDTNLEWAAIVAVVLWVASRGFDYFQEYRRNRRIRSNLVRSLFAEVDYNTQDLENFLINSPDLNVFREKLSDPQFVPHITDARHTEIYRENVSLLHNIRDVFIQELIAFYGDLEKIRAQIDGVRMPSYKSISIDGQVRVIRRLYSRCHDCMECGEQLVEKMRNAYPELKLQRSNDKPPKNG